jgi:hypothetical protein
MAIISVAVDKGTEVQQIVSKVYMYRVTIMYCIELQ